MIPSGPKPAAENVHAEARTVSQVGTKKDVTAITFIGIGSESSDEAKSGLAGASAASHFPGLSNAQRGHDANHRGRLMCGQSLVADLKNLVLQGRRMIIP
jgi:hypothetical protein